MSYIATYYDVLLLLLTTLLDNEYNTPCIFRLPATQSSFRTHDLFPFGTSTKNPSNCITAFPCGVGPLHYPLLYLLVSWFASEVGTTRYSSLTDVPESYNSASKPTFFPLTLTSQLSPPLFSVTSSSMTE